MKKLHQKLAQPIKHKSANLQWSLGFMSLSLHCIVLFGFASLTQKAIFLVHYGFFLLWQPVWRIQERVSMRALSLFLAFGAVFIYCINWWLIAFWIGFLFALLGGRVFNTQARSTRIGYLIAAGYLLMLLLILVIPKLLIPAVNFTDAEILMNFVMPFLILGILLTHKDTQENLSPPVLDFFYVTLLFLSACLLTLGFFAIESSGVNYASILLTGLFTSAFLLILISWLWQPRAGFSGFSQLFSKYLLSIGLPFEQWVKNIAELAKTKASAKAFIKAAMQEITTLNWIHGVSWKAGENRGSLGTQTNHHAQLSFNQVELRIDTAWALTPAMMMHVKLLTQILGEFYEAKCREELISQNAYMQAVHETGARLTHDMKNLVQSVSGLCAIAEQSTADESASLGALMQRQLPLLNQRMERILGKLTSPDRDHLSGTQHHELEKLYDWWEALKLQYEGLNIDFCLDATLEQSIKNMNVNSDFMDSIADNLIQNALRKIKENNNLKITVYLSNENNFTFEVIDNGKAMPATRAEQLFKRQVESEHGWGIGLYQANKQAEQLGYHLRLVTNKDGEVRFRLRRELN